MSEKILMLDSIRSAYNVGAIFRTADGAGVNKIFLAGYTPTPTDRFGRVQQEIEKTSLGASATVPWQSLSDIDAALSALTQLQEEGYSIVAIEQAPHATLLSDFTVPQKVVYILGNEIDGVSPELLASADHVVEIPMHGTKESLNVSVSAGIVLYKD